MSTKEKREYYADTANSEVRPDLVVAAGMIDPEKVAIDCGCGSGSDIAYLRKEGFTVHAFDIEETSIALCQERFKNDRAVYLSQDSFSSFIYPKSSLIVADASLFFCPENAFDFVWQNIYESLHSNGIFCGSFLGPDDTMASPTFDRDAFWPDVLVFEENTLRDKLTKFDIVLFNEHKVSGKTPRGVDHQWHVYSVVAKKI
ncbi:MAG: class I SAM-dependent methyltransferase [Agarilytica sp.]